MRVQGNYFPTESLNCSPLNVDQSRETIPSWKPFYLFSINLLNAVTRRISPLSPPSPPRARQRRSLWYRAEDSLSRLSTLREINDELDRSGRNTAKKEKQVKSGEGRWNASEMNRARVGENQKPPSFFVYFFFFFFTPRFSFSPSRPLSIPKQIINASNIT